VEQRWGIRVAEPEVASFHRCRAFPPHLCGLTGWLDRQVHQLAQLVRGREGVIPCCQLFARLGDRVEDGGQDQLAGDQLAEGQFPTEDQERSKGQHRSAGDGLEGEQTDDLSEEDAELRSRLRR